MNDRRNDLERFVTDLARSQPPRRAPVSLETRVLARLASRESSLAWWRKGFTDWPLAARIVFLIASGGAIKLAISGAMWITGLFGSQDFAGAEMLHRSAEAVSATASVGDAVLHAIPPTWLYGAVALAFALYAVLFGLGAVAYRTLYVER